MKKKTKSTYEEFIKDKKQKKLLDAEYKELLISEMLIAAMHQNSLSVRKLAEAAGVSPTIIQGLKTGAKKNITLGVLSKILDVLDYQIIVAPKQKEGQTGHSQAA